MRRHMSRSPAMTAHNPLSCDAKTILTFSFFSYSLANQMSVMALNYSFFYDPPVFPLSRSMLSLSYATFLIPDPHHLGTSGHIAQFSVLLKRHYSSYLDPSPAWRPISRHITCAPPACTDSFFRVCIFTDILPIPTSGHSTYLTSLFLHFAFMAL